jgi:hypothetical protein
MVMGSVVLLCATIVLVGLYRREHRRAEPPRRPHPSDSHWHLEPELTARLVGRSDTSSCSGRVPRRILRMADKCNPAIFVRSTTTIKWTSLCNLIGVVAARSAACFTIETKF